MGCGAVIAEVREAFDHKELLQNLTLRELRTRYRRSLLGWGWSLLNPLVITISYTLVFGVFLKIKPQTGQPSGNDTFAFFLLAGLLPWNYLANGILGSTGAMLGAHALISKVYFPRELIVFANVLSLLVTLVIELTVAVILLLLFGYSTLALLPWLIITIVLQTLFITGIALVLSAASVRNRDVPYLTGLALTVWFFITPIIYSVEDIPLRLDLLGVGIPVRTILLANPMARFTLAYRRILWDGTRPGLTSLAVLLAVSLVIFLAGYRYFSGKARYFAEEL